MDAINERLDTLNGRTRRVEQDVAILHDRAGAARADMQAYRGEIQTYRTNAIKLGAGIGALMSALAAGVMRYLGIK